tara:strand:- start:206 stop:484 length:279 start_codon:yes stop_codon:yes gene_type:complete
LSTLVLPCSGPADDGVPSETSVRLRVIKGIVYPTRFLALHGTVHHKRGCGDKISELKDVRIDSVPPIEVTNFPGKVPEAKARSQESFISPDD